MHIGAIQKVTLLDYPGKLACTVFLAGCNLRCPFCHNGGLVLPEQIDPRPIPEEELLSFLAGRRGKLDGVCITGGEPTIHRDLPELIGKIRALGFLVKLDTNGSNPRMLRELTQSRALDYVAMDIKNAPSRYCEICGGVDIREAVRESASILMAGHTDFEFRTTLSCPYHDEQAMEEIGAWLRGEEQYFLQSFVDSGNLVGSGSRPMAKETIVKLQTVLKKYIPNTKIRGL